MLIWITARTIHPGMQEEFKKAWKGFLQAGEIPGLLTVQYAVEDGNPRKVLGISVWESREACDSYRRSQLESDRTRKMNSCVESIDSSKYYDAEEIQLT